MPEHVPQIFYYPPAFVVHTYVEHWVPIDIVEYVKVKEFKEEYEAEFKGKALRTRGFVDYLYMYWEPEIAEEVIEEPSDELILEPGQYLIDDIIFGQLVVGEIGRLIYTEDYIRQMFYKGYDKTDKRYWAWVEFVETRKKKYVEKKFQRTEVPFTIMKSTLAQVRWVLHFKFSFEFNSIRPEVKFIDQFGIDSLELVSMIVEFEHYFGVRIELEDIEEGKIMTVQDLMDYLDFKRGKKIGKNLYPKQILYPAYVGLKPVYPSKNLFRPPIV